MSHALTWPEQEARRIFEQARSDFQSLGELFDVYSVDVELLSAVMFDLGVQRVPDLRVGARSYAGFLDSAAGLIVIEASHHEHRQRFSIAHELGHHVLHWLAGGQKTDSVFVCSPEDMEYGSPSELLEGKAQHIRREWEANLFAAELLMPEAPLRAMYQVTGGTVWKLCRHFRVSQRAMEIRLHRLGLLPTRG